MRQKLIFLLTGNDSRSVEISRLCFTLVILTWMIVALIYESIDRSDPLENATHNPTAIQSDQHQDAVQMLASQHPLVE